MKTDLLARVSSEFLELVCTHSLYPYSLLAMGVSGSDSFRCTWDFLVLRNTMATATLVWFAWFVFFFLGEKVSFSS